MSIIDPPILVEKKLFEVGTTGWTVDDLDEPEIEREWFLGRYEIVDGVMTKLAPAFFTGGSALQELFFLLRDHLRSQGVKCSFSVEVDVVLNRTRVARSDGMLMTAEERTRQNAAARREGKSDERRTRIFIPLTLIVETISPGHELHDLETKRRWYAEFGVPNYWIINAFKQTLDCFKLQGGQYRTDAAGVGDQILQPSNFPGLSIPLSSLWMEAA